MASCSRKQRCNDMTSVLLLTRRQDALEYLILRNLAVAPDSQPRPYSAQEVVAVQSHLDHTSAHLSAAQLARVFEGIKLSSSLATPAGAVIAASWPQKCFSDAGVHSEKHSVEWISF